MFDTHCHLNFNAFAKTLEEVIAAAHGAGVTHMVVPATDVKSARAALQIAAAHEHIYCAIGIHPHHLFELSQGNVSSSAQDALLCEVESMLDNPAVVAVGEVGLDRHYYTSTRYKKYTIDESFIDVQKTMLAHQIELAIKHDKSLVLHNREAKDDMLAVLDRSWDDKLRRRSVMHCCEADRELLEYAKDHDMYIGVDGDVTYDEKKKRFIADVPLEMLVVETDSPFLVPEPNRSAKIRPNTPANLPYIVKEVAKIKRVEVSEVARQTSQNAMRLFDLSPKE